MHPIRTGVRENGREEVLVGNPLDLAVSDPDPSEDGRVPHRPFTVVGAEIGSGDVVDDGEGTLNDQGRDLQVAFRLSPQL